MIALFLLEVEPQTFSRQRSIQGYEDLQQRLNSLRTSFSVTISLAGGAANS
jgi:hypothetical protein